MHEPGKLVVISGPSGTGKSTVLREVLRRTGARFSVSATTRQARPGEVDQEHYRFVDRETFEGMVRRGELLEWAEVFEQMYGTPAADVAEAIDAGQTIVLDIDVQGAVQVHEKLPDATFVLIVPPSDDELRRRLRERGTENDEEIQTRFEKAEKEIQAARQSGVYNHRVVNDDLERAVREMTRIVTQERESL